MSKLFEATTLNGMTLKNRFVRSATFEAMARADGACTPQLTDLNVELAKGAVGLIITGYAFVRPEGRQLPCTLGAHTDKFNPDLKKMVAAVHAEGGRICLQLVHVGGQTDVKNAGRTLIVMAVLMGVLFLGSVGITQLLGVVPSPQETIHNSKHLYIANAKKQIKICA